MRSDTIPLSDRFSGRHSRLFGSGASAVAAATREARRFREQAQLTALAHERIRSIYLDPAAASLSLPFYCYDETETAEEERERALALIPRLPVCGDQLELDEVLARGEGYFVCFAEDGRRFEIETDLDLEVILLGDLFADFSIGPRSRLQIQARDRSRGRLQRGVKEESYYNGISLADESKFEIFAPTSAYGHDRSVICPRNPFVGINLSDQAFCELGEAGHITANSGTTILLADDGRCDTIELDEPWGEPKLAPRIMDPQGNILLEGCSELEEQQLRGIRVMPVIPF